MFLVMTLLARDEEDILEKNLQFHLKQGVDHVIVTDNRSRDRTADIIRSFVRQGVASYHYEDGDTHDQMHWVTRMARAAHTQLGARWVINADADEFWMPTNAPNLREFFRGVEDYDIVEAEPHDFIGVEWEGESEPAEDFWKRMVYRRKDSRNSLGMPLLGKVAHKGDPNVLVWHGNHLVDGLGRSRLLRGELDILHFPARTREQYLRKITTGARALSKNSNLPNLVGVTWRKQYAELQDTGDIAFFHELILESEEVRRQLALGDLVLDTRLKDFLEK